MVVCARQNSSLPSSEENLSLRVWSKRRAKLQILRSLGTLRQLHVVDEDDVG